jgi:hypothetical protein
MERVEGRLPTAEAQRVSSERFPVITELLDKSLTSSDKTLLSERRTFFEGEGDAFVFGSIEALRADVESLDN